MGYPGTIRYDFDELDRGVVALRRAASAVEAELADLKSKLDNFLEMWEGEGNQTYVQIKAEWDLISAKLQTVGDDMYSRVTKVNNNMRDTEDGVVRTLRSHSVGA
jgi:WXG100 family type VII secretion target